MSYWRARSFGLVGASVTLFLAATGCGGVSANAGVSADEGCGQMATALCNALNACAPVFVQEQWGDATTCVARAKLSCTTDQGIPSITRTPDDLVACAKMVPSLSCADALAGKYPAACQPKPGMIANGAACGSNLQCTSTYCNKTDTCGVCSPRGAAGGACTVNEGCMNGLVCANKACVAPAEMGGACNLPGQPCRADLYCSASAGAGTCLARVEVGGSCAGNTGDACDVFKGAVCNTVFNANTCVTIMIAKGGDACGLAIKTACVGGVAPCSNPLTTGTCANPAQDGATCGGSAVCLPPATCVSGICRLPSTPDCH
jgi:hypothetical protein